MVVVRLAVGPEPEVAPPVEGGVGEMEQEEAPVELHLIVAELL